MILVDANLLIHAYNRDSSVHQPAREWLREVLSGAGPVGLSWHGIVAFVRVTTHPRVFARPLSIAQAVAPVNAWLEQPCVTLLEPGAGHWPILRDLLRDGQARGALATDAHLAALAMEHGATLCTTDRDFARFPGLRWQNPLSPP